MTGKTENRGFSSMDESKQHPAEGKGDKTASGNHSKHERHAAEGKPSTNEPREQKMKPGQPGHKDH